MCNVDEQKENKDWGLKTSTGVLWIYWIYGICVIADEMYLVRDDTKVIDIQLTCKDKIKRHTDGKLNFAYEWSGFYGWISLEFRFGTQVMYDAFRFLNSLSQTGFYQSNFPVLLTHTLFFRNMSSQNWKFEHSNDGMNNSSCLLIALELPQKKSNEPHISNVSFRSIPAAQREKRKTLCA